jgi:hypothetical protein
MDILRMRRILILGAVAIAAVLIPALLVSGLIQTEGGGVPFTDPLIIYAVFAILSLWLILPPIISSYVLDKGKSKQSYLSLYVVSAFATMAVSSVYLFLTGQFNQLCVSTWLLASLMAGCLGPAFVFLKRRRR